MKYAETEDPIPLGMHRSVERSITAQARIPLGMRPLQRNCGTDPQSPKSIMNNHKLNIQ